MYSILMLHAGRSAGECTASRWSLWVVAEMRLGFTSLAQSRDGPIIVDEWDTLAADAGPATRSKVRMPSLHVEHPMRHDKASSNMGGKAIMRLGYCRSRARTGVSMS